MSQELKDWQVFLIITMSIVAVLVVMWSFNGHWVTNSSPYNSYSLQAEAWLNGVTNIADYKHLELAYYQDKVYVSFPPFPSVVVLPFVMLQESTKTPDGFINLFFILIATFYAYKLARNFNDSVLVSLFLALFLTLSSNVLFLMQNGWVWFFAQTLSFTFTILSFYYATKKEANFYLAFLFLAFAIGCRPFQMVYGVVLLYFLLKETKDFKQIIYYILPAFVVGVFYASYNYVRFDSIFEFGHNYLREMTQSEHGQFSLVYVLENLQKLFYIPGMNARGILEYPRFNGFSILMLNPFLVVLFLLLFVKFIDFIRGIERGKEFSFVFIALVFGSIFVHVLLITMHITMGGWHFGNRYLIDILPAMFLVFVILDSKVGVLRVFYIPFFFFGFSLNILGTTLFYLK